MSDDAFGAGTLAAPHSPASPGESAPAGVPSVPSAKDIEVAPDKLFEVAEVLAGQADALRERVGGQLEALRIERPSTDIVSEHAVRGWNAVIVDGDDSYYSRVLAYIDGLSHLAEQLRTAGQRYHASEQDKSAAVAHAESGY